MHFFQSSYNLYIAGDTTIGGRAENQDNMGVIDTPLGCLVVVCDGMGGGPGGKTASAIAVDAISRTVMNASPQSSREEVLRQAIANAQFMLEKKVKETPKLNGMGSTAVVALVNAESAVIAHVGDSRCYRIKGNRMMFRTTDHSLVSELVQHKTLTEEEARMSPQSNVITRGLGSMSNHIPDIFTVPFCKGDRFVLCTDGIWGMMPNETLLSRFTSKQPTQAIVEGLQSEIDKMGFASGGGHDNHTLIIFETQTDSKLKDKMTKQTIAIIAALSVLLLISLSVNIFGGFRSSKSDNQETELRNAVEEIERLKAIENRYNALKEGDNGATVAELMKLAATNDSLLIILIEQNKKITKLRKEIDSLKAAKGGNKDDNGNKGKIANMSPTELADCLLIEFDRMKSMEGKTVAEAVKGKQKVGKKIVDLLMAFNTATGRIYNDDLSAFLSSLKDGNHRIYKVEEVKGNQKSSSYKSTNTAKAEIDKMRKKIEEIQKTLK